MKTLATIYLIGAVQGLFLAAILATRKKNTLANRILALWIFLYSFHLGELILLLNGYLFNFPHIFAITSSFPLLYGPFLYLYACALILKHPHFKKRSLLHFIPFLLDLIYKIPTTYIKSGEYKINFYLSLIQDGPTTTTMITSGLKTAHGLVYILFTFLLLHSYSRRLPNHFSNTDKINLNWLRLLTGIQTGPWGTALFLNLYRLFVGSLPAFFIKGDFNNETDRIFVQSPR